MFRFSFQACVAHIVLRYRVLLLSGNRQTPTPTTWARTALLHRAFQFDAPRELACYPETVTQVESLLQERENRLEEIEKALLQFQRPEVNEALTVTDLLESLPPDSTARRLITEAINEMPECGVCLEAGVESFFGCGHGLCAGCAGKVETCPYCRTVIDVRTVRNSPVSKVEKTEEAKKDDKKEPLRVLPISENTAFVLHVLQTLFATGKGVLSEDTKKEVDFLVEMSPNLVVRVLREMQGRATEVEHFPNEELEAYLLGQLFLKTTLRGKEIQARLDSPNRLLRFLAVLHGNAPETNVKIRMKFPRKTRLWLSRVLATWPDTLTIYAQLGSSRRIFQALFSYLHTGECKIPRVQELHRFVHSQETRSPAGRVEDLFLRKDIRVFELLLGYPGMFYRSASRLALTFPEFEGWDAFLEQMLLKLSLDQLMDLLHLLQPREAQPLVIFNKDGKINWGKRNAREIQKARKAQKEQRAQQAQRPGRPSRKKSVAKATEEQMTPQDFTQVSNRLLAAVQQELDRRLEGLSVPPVDSVEEPVGDTEEDKFPRRCVLGSGLEGRHLQRGRPEHPIAFLSQMPLSRGDWIRIDPDTEFRMGIWWIQQDKQVDLDLSVAGYNAEFETQDGWLCDYTQHQGFRGTMSYSGDCMSAPPPHGSSETTAFVPRRVKEANPGVRYLLLAVFVYTSGVSFEDTREALVFLGRPVKSGGIQIKGAQGPWNMELVSGSRLHGNAHVNLGCVLDLEENRVTFMNTRLSVRGGIVRSVKTLGPLGSEATKHFLEWTQSRGRSPSWDFQARLLAPVFPEVEVSGQRFQRKPGETITEFRDRIFARFSGAPEALLDGTSSGTHVIFGTPPGEVPENSILISPDPPTVAIAVTRMTSPGQLLHTLSEEEKKRRVRHEGKGKDPAD